MFITRATRHDKADIQAFLESHGWDVQDPGQGVFFFARDGRVVGSIRFIEVAPQIVVVQDMVVHEDRRNEGIGTQLMRAAMNSRGGTLYLRCTNDLGGYYERLGFAEVPRAELPAEVATRFEDAGELPGSTVYMKAR